jgi:hypothetical protein
MEPVARCSIQPVFTAIDIGIQLAWGCLIKGVVGEFLGSLIERGMYSVEFIVSDAHERLGNAARSTCSKTPCSSPQCDIREAISDDLRGVFNAGVRSEAERLLKVAIEEYEQRAPRLRG